MRLDIDPKVDVAFKLVFGNEDNALQLVSLLNAVLGQPGSVTGVEIVLPHSDKESPQDKTVIGDIKAHDQGNRQFHLEMQAQVPEFFPKRVVYYGTKFHAQQLHQGEHYMTLRPTIAICFLNRALFPTKDYHLHFQLREATHDLLFCEDLEIHWIQLPLFTKSAEELTTPLDRWCYFLRHGADLDLEHLPASLDVPDIRRAMEVLTVFTQEERERERYELRLKYEHDQISLAHENKENLERACAEALKEGIEQGRKEGAVDRIHLAQRLLKQAMRPREELLALPLEELLRLADALEQQLFPATNGASGTPEPGGA